MTAGIIIVLAGYAKGEMMRISFVRETENVGLLRGRSGRRGGDARCPSAIHKRRREIDARCSVEVMEQAVQSLAAVDGGAEGASDYLARLFEAKAERWEINGATRMANLWDHLSGKHGGDLTLRVWEDPTRAKALRHIWHRIMF
jgi:hypothetical protein